MTRAGVPASAVHHLALRWAGSDSTAERVVSGLSLREAGVLEARLDEDMSADQSADVLADLLDTKS